MSELFGFLGKWVADYIQRGSLRHAAQGAFFGILVASTLAYTLWVSAVVTSLVVTGIGMSLVAGIVGGMIGSRFEDRRTPLLLAGEKVSVWNLNYALGPFMILTAIGSLAAALAWRATTGATPDLSPSTAWIVTSIAVGAAVFSACIVTFGIQIGEDIRVIRLPLIKVYQRSQVKCWGFQVTGGRLVPRPGKIKGAPLVFQFDDGVCFRCEVSGVTAERVIRAMQ